MYVLPCLSVVTMGYHVIHLMYVLVINLRVPPMNLCIGVGTCFRLDSPVEILGHPLKLSYWIESFMRTLDVCLAVFIYGDNGISRAT